MTDWRLLLFVMQKFGQSKIHCIVHISFVWTLKRSVPYLTKSIIFFYVKWVNSSTLNKRIVMQPTSYGKEVAAWPESYTPFIKRNASFWKLCFIWRRVYVSEPGVISPRPWVRVSDSGEAGKMVGLNLCFFWGRVYSQLLQRDRYIILEIDILY